MLPKHKAKKYLQNILDHLPSRMGYSGYHYFQHHFSNIELDQQINSSYNSYQAFLKLTGNQDIPVKNASILEIGSGWLPIMPYFFKYLSGAREVCTFDLNCHYDAEKIKDLNKEFLKSYDVEISEDRRQSFGLPADIQYFPNTDICQIDIPAVDLIFSRYVLEHVTPVDIKQMHRKFKDELHKGAHIVHMISPSDHRAYDNKELSLQDFLRYSPEEWDRKQTKFDYHNRLRLPEYIELFTSLGYEIVHLTYDNPDKDSEAFKKFKNVPLHEDYRKFSDEELTAGSINIILRT